MIIDHLTPPLTRAETYGPLRDLEALVDEYFDLLAQQDETQMRRKLKLSSDNLMSVVHLIREMVAKELPAEDVNKMFISVTHTHAAPVVMPDNFVIPPGIMSVEDYGKFFARQVADAIVKQREENGPFRNRKELKNLKEKLEKITKETIKENVTSISGVPSWNLVG